jgi:hypothetical protein
MTPKPQSDVFRIPNPCSYDSVLSRYIRRLEFRAAAWAKSARKWRSTARYQGRHITSIQEELASCCSAEELRQVREAHTLLQREFEQQRTIYQIVVKERAALQADLARVAAMNGGAK